jgi:putative tributyrin esterase
MADFNISFFSNALRRTVSFQMIMPNDPRCDMPAGNEDKGPLRTLFLLHGYTGCAGNYVPLELIQKYNIAVIMPNGENSFYLDGLGTGRKYCTFVGNELVKYVHKTFGLADSAADTNILGFSMGGFGALHTALSYPESFGMIGAMSSALIVHEIAHMKENYSNDIADYDYYHSCFGNLDTVEGSTNNPETLILNLKEKKKKIPEIYLCCGSEDFLIEKNRQFHAFLKKERVTHSYYESTGIHDQKFWDEYTPKIIEWMYGNK